MQSVLYSKKRVWFNRRDSNIASSCGSRGPLGHVLPAMQHRQ